MDQPIEAVTSRVLENVYKKMTSSVATQTEVVVRPRQAVKTKTVETQTEEIQMEQDPVFRAEKSICAVYLTVRVILHVSGRAAVGP